MRGLDDRALGCRRNRLRHRDAGCQQSVEDLLFQFDVRLGIDRDLENAIFRWFLPNQEIEVLSGKSGDGSADGPVLFEQVLGQRDRLCA